MFAWEQFLFARCNHIVCVCVCVRVCRREQYTRTQRIVTLFAMFLTSLMVVAFLFGNTKSSTLVGSFMTTVFAGCLMIPGRLVIPRLFRASNAFPSLGRWGRMQLVTVALMYRRQHSKERSTSRVRPCTTTTTAVEDDGSAPPTPPSTPVSSNNGSRQQAATALRVSGSPSAGARAATSFRAGPNVSRRIDRVVHAPSPVHSPSSVRFNPSDPSTENVTLCLGGVTVAACVTSLNLWQIARLGFSLKMTQIEPLTELKGCVALRSIPPVMAALIWIVTVWTCFLCGCTVSCCAEPLKRCSRLCGEATALRPWLRAVFQPWIGAIFRELRISGTSIEGSIHKARLAVVCCHTPPAVDRNASDVGGARCPAVRHMPRGAGQQHTSDWHSAEHTHPLGSNTGVSHLAGTSLGAPMAV